MHNSHFRDNGEIIRIKRFSTKKRRFLHNYDSKGTIVNWTCPSLLEGHLKLKWQSLYASKLKGYNAPKKLSLCHKLWFSNPNIFGTQCRKPLIFQASIVWSNKSRSLKCQRFTTLESKDTGIRKSEFVAKTQFLSRIYQIANSFIILKLDQCHLRCNCAVYTGLFLLNNWFLSYWSLFKY